MVVSSRCGDAVAMNRKRAAAAVLWFFAGWYAAAFVALLVGAPDVIGPFVGAALAVVFAGDPLGRIWTRRDVTETAAEPAAEHGSQTAEPIATR
jgi:hypothetical protein